MKRIRFLTSYSPYNVGEVAGFPDDQARRLVTSGVAEMLVVTPPAAPAAPVATVISAPPLDTALVSPRPNRRAHR